MYERYPAGPDVEKTGTPDYTYGFGNPASKANSELIEILQDIDAGPGSVNEKHRRNPRQTRMLDAKVAADNTSPGVGTDYVFRDPWGNPYIITLDMNDDGKCEDLIYGNPAVGEANGKGLFGLVKNTNNKMALNNSVMVWSCGPDKAINPSGPANAGKNKDNVLGWQ
jgi:hypothetical protein